MRDGAVCYKSKIDLSNGSLDPNARCIGFFNLSHGKRIQLGFRIISIAPANRFSMLLFLINQFFTQ